MDEPKRIALTHKEVTEALIKHQNLHEGLWQIYVRFAISAANMPTADESQELKLCPTAIVPITEIGLVLVDSETPLSVDASKVNPLIPKF